MKNLTSIPLPPEDMSSGVEIKHIEAAISCTVSIS